MVGPVIALLLAVAAFDGCAEGEGFDESQLPPREGGSHAGAAGIPTTTGMGGNSPGAGGGAGTAEVAGAGGLSGGSGAGVDASASGGNSAAGGSAGAGGGSGGSGGAGGSAGTGGTGGGGSAGAGGAGGAGGTIIVSDAGPTCDYSKSPVYALIANQGNGGPNPTDNVIQFDLKLVNTSASAIALSTLKVRYYFTDENAGPSTSVNFFSKIDGATYIPVVDATKVLITRFDLMPAKTGANAYLEFTFDASLGSLPAGDYIWARAQFHHDDYKTFNESDDYSYNPGNTPADEAAWEACKNQPACPSFSNCKTVVLQNTTVVFGVPPP